MFSRGVLSFLSKRGVKAIGPISLDHSRSHLDEPRRNSA